MRGCRLDSLELNRVLEAIGGVAAVVEAEVVNLEHDLTLRVMGKCAVREQETYTLAVD